MARAKCHIKFFEGQDKDEAPNEFDGHFGLYHSTSLHAKNMNMLKGLANTNMKSHMDDHPIVIPFFMIDVVQFT